MKGLKRNIIASSVIASIASTANAELKQLDDSLMGQVTGQAGITIELQTQIDVGSLVVIDEGNLSMNNIHIGGAGGTVLDNMTIDIDINADGDAVLNLTALDGSNKIDFEASIGSIELNGLGGENLLLASNLAVQGFIASANMTVDTATSSLNITAGARITDLDLDIDFLGMGIRNVTIGSDNSLGLITDPTNAAINASTGAMYLTARVYSAANSHAASGQALTIDVDAFEQDLTIGALELGGASIGSFAIQDEVISNTHMQVYGH